MYDQLVADLFSADAGIRFYAAQRLGKLDDPRAGAALTEALRDESAKVQYAALSSLIKLEVMEALDPIITMLLADRSSRVWELLKLSIGLRLRAGLLDLVRRGDLALSDRLYAALQTDELPEPKPLDEYQQALFMRLIGRTGDTRRLDDLLTLLDSDVLTLRVASVEGLGYLGDTRAVPTLVGVLTDPADAIRETAAEALGRIGDKSAFTGVLASLRDPNEWVRRAAAEALGIFGDDRAVEALTDALNDQESMVQDAAFDSLKKLSSDHFTTTL
ncbi:MAG: HEAT repeat domain-containing protein [Chloroflexota bacterium]|nr:HEAT repeat domain-containing protein [Chloroflexota bacterium]